VGRPVGGRTLFDINTLKGKQTVLFGAGNEGVCAVDILRKNGINPICFCDNYKEGIERRTGLRIISTKQLIRDYSDAIIILTAIGYTEEIIDSLKKAGINEDKIITDFRAHLYKQPYLAYFELNIVDHCNITCKSCSHFSPLAEAHVSPLDSVQNDLRRMSELTAQNVDEIHILGGEPLLHPELKEILISARQTFPKTIIAVITNGVLLLKQDEKFWNVCKENLITIEVTKYPIKLDYPKILKEVEDRGITFKFHSYTGKAPKMLYKLPLDREGRQDADKSFYNCTLANRWIALMDGKIYTCQTAPNVFHFNKRFGVSMDLQDGDYLDIYKAKNIEEILSFLCIPKPFCKYCKTTEIINGIPWQASTKEINEWV
jgi:MoaA/NifB/PqqE/SkfB family radical SAM enzyme